jgi:hypothetical protein
VSDRRESPSNGGETPRIIVRYVGTEPSAIKWVEHGVEEEGVPWSIRSLEEESDIDHSENRLVELAYQAASDSRLKIGVVISQDDDIVLHHARLPADEPLFSVVTATRVEAKTIGTNAARLAKRMPLKSLD